MPLGVLTIRMWKSPFLSSESIRNSSIWKKMPGLLEIKKKENEYVKLQKNLALIICHIPVTAPFLYTSSLN